MKYENLISRLGLEGFETIEPPIMVSFTLGLPIRLIGGPGSGKTLCADLLSVIEHGPSLYRRLDCPKENIVTIAGMPNIEDMKHAIFSFVHEGADGKSGFIWDKKHITFNEITRISPEGANLILEILQERTLFGLSLPIQRQWDPRKIDYSIMATENPEGVGVKRVDDAVFDRFYMAVNVPDMQRPIGREIRRGITEANLKRGVDRGEAHELIRSFLWQMRETYAQIQETFDIRQPVAEYCSSFWESYFGLPDNQKARVSNRRQANFTEMVLGFAAYQQVVEGDINLVQAADMALLYGVVIPLRMSKEQQDNLYGVHNKTKLFLSKDELTPKERFEAELNAQVTIRDRVQFITQNLPKFLDLFNLADREVILGKRIIGDRSVLPSDYLPIHKLLTTIGVHQELTRKVEVLIVGTISEAITEIATRVSTKSVTTFDDTVEYEDFQRLHKLISTSPLPSKAVELLLTASSTANHTRINDLIDIYERAQPAKPARKKAA